MVMRYQWGNPLIVFTVGLFLCLDAHAQLVGGSSTNAGFDPSKVVASPTAFAFGQDPLAGQNFSACLAQANAMASIANLPDITQITPDNALASGVSTLGGIVGGALGGGVSGAGVGAGAFAGATGNVCNGPLPEPKFGDSCDAFKVGDSFSAAKLNAAILQVNQAAQAAACKTANAAKAEAVVGCFRDEFQSIKDNMALVKKDFDANILAMGQYETTVKAAVELEDQKQEALTAKISSLGETKSKIEAILKQVNGSSGSAKNGGSNDTVAGLQIQVNTLNDKLTAFSKHQKAALAGGTASCFQGQGASSSGIHNCPNAAGDLLPPKDCVLSIFRDGVALQFSGGSNRVSPADKRKADLAKTKFENRLNQMLGDFSGDNPRIPDAAAFIAQYGGELNGFGAAGQQMIQELNNCGAQSKDDIAKQLANPESGLGSEAVAAKNTSQELSSNIGGMINTLDTAFRDAGKEVFGQELNGALNGFGCNTAAVDANQSAGGDTSAQPVALATQMKCVKALNANLTSMLNGTPPPGGGPSLSVPLNVPGMDGAQPHCSGLRDCLVVAGNLKSASVALEKKLNGSGTFPDSRCPGGCPGLKKFHTDSNNNIQAALQQTADLYKRRVDIAKAEFSQVKGVLGAVDLDFPTKTPKGQNLSDVCPKSSESICQMPGDFDSKLAGLAGVPDLQSTDFDAKKKDALDKKNEFAGKQTEFKNQAIALNTLATTCKKEAGDKKLAKGVGKIREDFNRKLSKCKAAAGRLNATPPDFGPQLDGLQADLQRVCAADTANDDCSKLSSEMADASTACNDIFDDRLQKKKDADDAKANGRCALCDRAACAQVGLPVPPACEGGKIGVDSNKK